ncbi:MAG TPA: thiamine phosphate synthase [Thermoanaerobaculia bacterium]|nr:thiamine phosphate synthase [Thermoanaerobaculia bacterium]
MKSVYVTDRAAIGDARFGGILERLAGARDVSVVLREPPGEDRALLDRARQARVRLGDSVPLYVHRRYDVALAAGAAGVHLPSDGLPVARVRSETPRGFRIGVSTHAVAEAERALEDGADLVFLGPIFDTPSKRAYGPPLGVEILAALPPRDGRAGEVYAIGGVEEERLPELAPYAGRLAGIAAIRLFQESPDPRGAAERIAAR